MPYLLFLKKQQDLELSPLLQIIGGASWVNSAFIIEANTKPAPWIHFVCNLLTASTKEHICKQMRGQTTKL